MIDIAELGTELEKYENKWIAIDESEEKIVGVGDNAFEATAEAERNGYQETILFKVPSVGTGLLGQQGFFEQFHINFQLDKRFFEVNAGRG